MPARARPRMPVGFIEPMLLQRVERLPDGPAWLYELKLDGYRAVAFSAGGRVHLRSRNDNDFTARYPSITAALARLPADTVIDGEVVALDGDGRPSFSALQNNAATDDRLVYFVFDLLMVAGQDVRSEPLHVRQHLLDRQVLSRLAEPIRASPRLDAALDVLVASVRQFGFEGLVAKRRDSRYESGQRSGAWLKMRVNRGQEFVIAGYTIGAKTFDALIIGYYEGEDLIYAARTRNGFTPASRAQLFTRFRGLETTTCPFANLPEVSSGRWGQGLTKAKMADCRWLLPRLVGHFEFLEWTGEHHLRHSRFVALRNDKDPREVTRE